MSSINDAASLDVGDSHNYNFDDDDNYENLDEYEVIQTEKVKALEERYADRGLKFTTPFQGYVPVQAFGHLDGYRFYFRYRGNVASLRLGVFNQKLENAVWQVHEQDRLDRVSEHQMEDYDPSSLFSMLGDEPDRFIKESDTNFFPREIHKVSSFEHDDDYEWPKDMTEEEALFIILLEQDFIEIPEEERIDDFDKAALNGTVEQWRKGLNI